MTNNIPKHLSEKIEKEADAATRQYEEQIAKGERPVLNSSYCTGYGDGFDAAAQKILSDPGVWGLAGGWVNCRDRLPVEDGLYIIEHRNGGKWQMFFKTEDKKWYWQPNPYSVCGDGFIERWLDPSAPGERELVDKEGVKALYEAYRKYDGPLLFTDWLDSNPIETLKNHKQ